MATILQITRFLNKLLDIRHVPDSSKNGMQVRSSKEIKKVAFAVDACMEVFERAKKENCDLVIVHHGIFWKKKYQLQKQLDKRVNFLKNNNISLYASHLPLDLHLELGNAAQIAKILDLEKVKEFGIYGGIFVGVQGVFKNKIMLKEIKTILDKKLQTKSKAYKFNDNKIKSIGIVTGGGASTLNEAIEKKLDCFLTGEESHSVYHYAKEGNLDLTFAGHYATETLGVKALMPTLKEKFDVETIFIDVPTGM